MLDQDATYLSQLGFYTDDITQLLSFEFEMDDDFGAIADRYESGYFGMGQSTVLDATASTDSSGDITIIDQGLVLQFLAESGGTYLNTSGNGDTVSVSSSASIQLEDPSGDITAFLPDGQFDYFEDKNGNTLERRLLRTGN